MTIVGIFLNNELRTGGHRRYLELMEGLAERGNRVVVLMNSLLGYEPRVFVALTREVRYRRKSFPPASWVFRVEAEKSIEDIRRTAGIPDIVLVFGETHLAAGARLASGLGAPLVYAHRSNAVREYLTFLDEPGHGCLDRLLIHAELVKSRLDEWRITRESRLLVFQSEFDREDFVGRNPSAAERSIVIRGDISGARFKPEYALANKSVSLKTVCFMGTLGQRKGAQYLIEAIIELARRGHSSLRFRICGPGERQEAFETRLRDAGVSDMAIFTGRVADPFAEIASSDLLVVPSLFDSYPNTILEALHVGTPVIGSSVGGIPDMLARDELLFSPMDSVAIADRIERCLVEPAFYALVRELCAERRDYFRFDWPEAWERAMYVSPL